MSAFAGQLVIRALAAAEVAAAGSDVQLYELQANLFYASDVLAATLQVPVGFVTDFASIPRAAWVWMDPEDPVILYPSVVHDYLYKFSGRLPNFPGRVFTRLEADQVLREAMGLCGARWDQKAVVFAAVRAGGWVGASNWQDEPTPKEAVSMLQKGV